MRREMIDASQLELEETVVAIKRVTKVVKGGRNMRFAALVVVGDKNGHVGAGLGKATEIPEAIRKGKEDAMKSLITVPIDENKSIPYDIIGKYTGAQVLLKKAPEYDYMVAPEAKAIPLVHELARQSGRNYYILARKAKKFYMKGVFSVEDKSITTEGTQTLYMDGADAAKLQGKRVLLVDDVISTGGSMAAVEALVNQAGGNIVGRMTILAEGAAADRDDIIYLERLPLFDGSGNPR